MLEAALLAALLAAPSQAKMIAVSKKGPVKTLKDALLAAEPGDELTFADRGAIGFPLEAMDDQYVGSIQSGFVDPNGPAGRSGMNAEGDSVVEINGKSTKDMNVRQALALLMDGPAGSKVKLKVIHLGEKKKISVQFLRGPLSFTLGDECERVFIARSFMDDEAALAVAEAGAEKGKLACQIFLTKNYRYTNAWKAAKYAEACAKAGSKECQETRGDQLLRGSGADKNPSAGLYWLRQAAENKSVAAYSDLARAYLSGDGVPVDKALARYWYERAASAGDKENVSASLAKLASVPAAAGPGPLPPAPEGAVVAAPAKPGAAIKSDVDAPSYKKAERENDVAVVVGVEKYPDLPAATYAERDADAVRAHVVALGFPERNIFLLKGQQATRTALAKELETRLPRLVNEKSTVFVYFSGHGAPDPKNGDAYLMPIDGDPNFLEQTGYPLKKLYSTLGVLKAKRVVVALDSCFSGAGGRSVLAKGIRPLVIASDAAKLSGRVVSLTAAGGSEISSASDEQGHGLFTYYLLKGLNDGKTKLGPLAGYLTPKVQNEARRQSRDQTPQLAGEGAAQTELAQ